MRIVFALLAAIAATFASTGFAQTNEPMADQAAVPRPLTAQPPIAQVSIARPSVAQPPIAEAAAPSAASDTPKEFRSEYGTPATVIRGFYAALAEGNGDLAALAVVPEKTVRGAFSPSEMNRFYGNLREPITLVDLFRTGKTEYVAHYRYDATAQPCDGRAVITTVTRGQRFYIEKTRALNKC